MACDAFACSCCVIPGARFDAKEEASQSDEWVRGSLGLPLHVEMPNDVEGLARAALRARPELAAEVRPRRASPPPASRPVCPYCGLPTALVGGDVVYPHRPDLVSKRFWLCHPCDAYVGCHPGTERPLGTPANADLRALRSKVHAALDPLWRSGRMRRSEAYERLAAALGIPGEECHVGMFDEVRCLAALGALRQMGAP